jgi:hypothetical protein
MPSQNYVLCAIPGAFKGVGVPVEYWTSCYPEDLEDFLNNKYEFWKYDIDSATDDKVDTPEQETGDYLSWEYPPVQMFAKREGISREFVASCSRLLGLGNEFSFQEVAAEFPNFIARPAKRIESRANSKNDRTCPWCNVTAVKRYNFFRPDYNEFTEAPYEMDNPVLWTDGCWSEVGVDQDTETFMDNQYGDSVVCCPACSALFLASRLEKESERAEIEASGRLFPADAFVAPGKHKKGHFESSLSDEWIVFASLDKTLDYLEQGQDARGDLWSKWTASQQVINWMSYLTRTGKAVSPEQDQRARDLLLRFRESMSEIIEGTLGAFYGFVDVIEESSDPNYWDHAHALEESFALANLRRIIGDWHEIEFTLGGNLDGVKTVQEIQNSGWSEFDQYIMRRRLLLSSLIETKETRWAVHSGEIDGHA